MKITKDETAKVAKLARLELSEEKLELFTAQLGDILAYMDKLGELDTSQTEPLYTPVSHTTVVREDEPARTVAREQILSGAPEDDGQFFIVPKIVG
ncbi:MAG: aspartyl-tRNA(Asn)/glutamyl-tRNA(Gln) amidotransferase subunit [Desulfovibrionales bacterium]|jgi:aspartyl-tRNA(Asn)/glutamyl-tRNA(Gln) amidotransferase subunit C|nr:aspartyl-tRNA(Asn)/glutamyl-tRNA(Gln) amidotransferase subunit [Desulfovibrionales bacterium]